MAAEITDSELREELTAFGVDVGPITDATRKLWVRKLDKLNAEKRKKRRSAPVPNGGGKSVGGFSSDPDEDYDVVKPGAKSRLNNNNNNRRQSSRFDSTPTKKTNDGAETSKSSNAGVVPGAANIKGRYSLSGAASKAADVRKLSEFVRRREEGEISDSESETEAKKVDDRKTTTTTTTIKTTTTKDRKWEKNGEGDRRRDGGVTKAEPTISHYTRPFDAPFSSNVSSTISSASSTSSSSSALPKLSSLISGRPGISRLPLQPQQTTVSRNNPVAPTSALNAASRLDPSLSSSSSPKLVFNDSVVSDPHNSLSSELRPRLPMSNIGPRSSTPYSGYIEAKLGPTSRRSAASGENGTLGPVPAAQPWSTVRGAGALSNFEGPALYRADAQAPTTGPISGTPRKFQTTDEEILSKEFKTSSEGFMSTYSHYISVVIVVLAGGFFFALTLAYLNLFSYDLPKEKLKIPDASVETRRLVTSALEELQRIVVQYNCGERETPTLSAARLKAAIKTDDASMIDVFSRLRSWNDDDHDDDGVRISIDFLDVRGHITDGSVHAVKLHSDFVPFKCRVVLFCQKFAAAATTAAVSFVTFWLIYRFWKNRKLNREMKRKKLFAMVDSILEFLGNQSQAIFAESGDRSPIFAVMHVRDALIAPADRVGLMPTWEAACAFIAKNESRIREERQAIKGEDFIVWRWIADPRVPQVTKLKEPVVAAATTTNAAASATTAAASASIAASLVSQATPDGEDDDATNAAVSEAPVAAAPSAVAASVASPASGNQWQGQAFQNIRLNAPPYSLTQCLKIRNMFDPDAENGPALHVRLQDAILEKCGPAAHVQHVAVNVDKVSREGCVYVKCRDAESAGVAYRNLHGWWFDGNLVSVKYLPLKRYHERFPETAYASTLLQPSSFKLVSAGSSKR